MEHKSLERIEQRYNKAVDNFGSDYNSFHEGYAILLEEVDELWEQIKKKDQCLEGIQSELLDVATVVFKLFNTIDREEAGEIISRMLPHIKEGSRKMVATQPTHPICPAEALDFGGKDNE